MWWGHQCLSYVPAALGTRDRDMLALVESWVRQPDEHNRRAALDAPSPTENETPGVWLALAVGWSGGSMVGPHLPAVAPPPFATPRAINAAILALLAMLQTDDRNRILPGFVGMAVKLTELG